MYAVFQISKTMSVESHALIPVFSFLLNTILGAGSTQFY